MKVLKVKRLEMSVKPRAAFSVPANPKTYGGTVGLNEVVACRVGANALDWYLASELDLGVGWQDPAIIARIVAAIRPQTGDRLVEIGPGQAAITASPMVLTTSPCALLTSAKTSTKCF